MARRRRHHMPGWVDAKNPGLTATQASDAMDRLSSMERATIDAMVNIDFDVRQALYWTFQEHKDAWRIMHEAYGRIESPTIAYTSYPVVDGVEVQFQNWEHLKVCAPLLGAQRISAEFEDKARQIQAELNPIRRNFEVCRVVLRWMTNNCTNAAVRHYWPMIGALAPDMKEVAERFREPQGVGPVLPLIRASVDTLAAALLLPKWAERSGQHEFELIFSSYTETTDAEVDIRMTEHTLKGY